MFDKFKQVSAMDLEELNRELPNGSVKLLPSSRNYDWSCFNFGNIFPFQICNGKVITVGRARNANTKYWEGDFISSQNHIIQSFDETKLLPKFLYYFILQNDKKFYETEGSYPIFTKTIFMNLQIPLPPLPVQEEIVKILDTFTELEAELEAELEKRRKQFEFYRNQILSFNSVVAASTKYQVPSVDNSIADI